MAIKLSVAIPTYNGSRYIREALDSIISQFDDIDEEVEIVVSDNASIDQTPEIVREYQERCSVIKYFRNEKNVGFDRNCDLAVRRARGEFVWLLSDDDKIRDGGVKQVLEVIDTHPSITTIFVNYERFPPIKCSQDCLCVNGDEFLDKSSFKSGLASSNVVRKAEWELLDMSKYFDTGWIHMGFLIEALSTRPGFIISHPFLLQVGAKEARWGENGSFFNTGLRLVRIFRTMGRYGYTADTIRKAILVIKGGYLVNIPLAKAQGLKVNAGFIKEVYGLYKNYPSFWIVDLPLLLIPSILYKAAYKIAYGAYRMRIFNKPFKKLIDKIYQ